MHDASRSGRVLDFWSMSEPKNHVSIVHWAINLVNAAGRDSNGQWQVLSHPYQKRINLIWDMTPSILMYVDTAGVHIYYPRRGLD